MTIEARDAVDWTVLKDWPGPVMGYVDGSRSMWPAEAWQYFQGRPCGHITVLANESYEIFDVESDNASAAAVATAVANRLQDKQWSVVYSNQLGLPGVQQALRSKSIGLVDAGFWPAPGVYLWCADPDGAIAAGLWVPPVDPLGVQHTWAGTYDQSTCYSGWLAPTQPAPAPQPPAPTYPSSNGGQMLTGCVGMAATPTGKGYWQVQSDGGVFTHGDAEFFGSMGGHALAEPVVGIVATPTGKGYWLVASDGGVFSFGDAAFEGSGA